ncbi:uncharacterized protein EV420DRAFT_605069 [Desarmillaria tabescens]|uniref:F-box domain-containing protein n=1 Tax=Armillaria tabescens TaxID=1929756 RepID=A0AA39N0Z3_ARMTA|nr:uncharacterized protein EV420DRAFT_605069 [Desarmillaria tabescens]KAK0454201.1 hypothetical protein EV420DRAFT_605069 [Desarmillaria tabescens]
MDPTFVLPLEIIHKIFHHYLKDCKYPVQSLDFSDGPWVLEKVSSAWRNAALISQSLWSSINIIIIEPEDPLHNADLESTRLGSGMPRSDGEILPPTGEASSDDGEEDKEDPLFVVLNDTTNRIVTEILHRSGNSPLDVTILFPIILGTVPQSWIQFFSLIPTSSFRWKALDLEAPDELWEHFVGAASVPASYPTLRDMRALLERQSAILTRIVRVCSNVEGLELWHHIVASGVDVTEDANVMLSLKRARK